VPLLEGGAGTPPFGSGGPGSAFAPTPDAGAPAFDLTLVPYHRWAERGPSTMRVFVPTARHEETR
jgi:hypothetical protein